MTETEKETIQPSEMLKNKMEEPLTEEQQNMIDAIEKDIPNSLPEMPKLKEEDISSLKQSLDTIMNDERAVDKRIDYEYYANNKEFFTQFYNDYTVNNTITAMDIKKYINSLTNFKYDPFEGIRANLLFSVQDRLLYVHELGKIFDNDFLGEIDIQFKLHDLDMKVSKFIGKHEVPFNDFEHKLIKNMMGKLLLSMYSNVERSFVQETHCLSSDYVKNLKHIDKVMRNMCRSDKYVMKSWSTFMNKLLDTKTMFKFSDYAALSEKLKMCYDNRFPIEILMADCVKSLIPSIGFNYVNAIKDIYLIGRLVGIYVNKFMQRRIDGKEDADRIRLTDLIVICRAMMVEYESNYFATAMIPRSMPKAEENTSEEFKLYYISHTLTGPQYFLLKQLEYTIPSLKYQ